MRRLRWGILGCGSVATTAVAPAIRWSRNGELAAIGSRTLARAEERARATNAARAHGSYDALLADPGVDAVYIGVPNGEHTRWALAAASAGKHVLCEKSLTLSVAGARIMRAAFASRGLRLVEGFMVRHHPQWSVLQRLLREGVVGEIDHVRAWFRARLDAPDDHRWSAELGGGALFDLTCYPVNLARFVFGEEPRRVRAAASFVRPGVDASTDAILEFGGGRIATVHGSLRGASEQGVVIGGTRGRIVLARPFVPGWDATEVVVEVDGGERVAHVVPGANHYLHLVEHVAACALDASLPLEPAEDGVGNVAV